MLHGSRYVVRNGSEMMAYCVQGNEAWNLGVALEKIVKEQPDTLNAKAAAAVAERLEKVQLSPHAIAGVWRGILGFIRRLLCHLLFILSSAKGF